MGIYSDLMGIYRDLMGIYSDLIGINNDVMVIQLFLNELSDTVDGKIASFFNGGFDILSRVSSLWWFFGFRLPIHSRNFAI